MSTGNRRLLNIQRKQLHDLLVASGIDPSRSKWTDDKKDWTSHAVDTLEIGLCYFLFEPESNGLLTIKCRPAPDGDVERGTVNKTWKQVLELFFAWAKYVKSETEQEDPWAKYAMFISADSISSAQDNSPFSYVEAERASEAIKGLLAYLELQVPPYGKVKEIYNKHFERMAESAKKGAGRIDWSNQFLGLFINLCVTLSLAPETASGIWNTWMRLITKLLGP